MNVEIHFAASFMDHTGIHASDTPQTLVGDGLPISSIATNNYTAIHDHDSPAIDGNVSAAVYIASV